MGVEYEGGAGTTTGGGAGLDPEALTELLCACRARLLAYIGRQWPAALADVLDPQDLLQETYLEAFRRAACFVPDGRPDAGFRWLAAIARTRIVQAVRTHKATKRGGKRRRLDGEAPAEGGPAAVDSSAVLTLLEQLAVYKRTPSQSAAAHELAGALEWSLSLLPTQYAEVMRLRHVLALSWEEVGRRMNRSVAAVEGLHRRALSALREELRAASLFV